MALIRYCICCSWLKPHIFFFIIFFSFLWIHHFQHANTREKQNKMNATQASVAWIVFHNLLNLAHMPFRSRRVIITRHCERYLRSYNIAFLTLSSITHKWVMWTSSKANRRQAQPSFPQGYPLFLAFAGQQSWLPNLGLCPWARCTSLVVIYAFSLWLLGRCQNYYVSTTATHPLRYPRLSKYLL